MANLIEALEDPIVWDSTNFGPWGGFAVHTLAIPHEWKANGTDQDWAPIIRRVGCTLDVENADWSNARPWIAIVRLDLSDDVDLTMPGPWPSQSWKVVAATVFDDIGLISGSAYGGLLKLDSIGLNSNSKTIAEMSGFPVECPVVKNDPDFGTPPWSNPIPAGEQSYVYLMCVGIAMQTQDGVLLQETSLHSGWCEYYLPEVLSGF